MRRTFLSRTHQGDLFSPPAKLPELPVEVRQKMTRLLAKNAERILAAPPFLRCKKGAER